MSLVQTTYKPLAELWEQLPRDQRLSMQTLRQAADRGDLGNVIRIKGRRYIHVKDFGDALQKAKQVAALTPPAQVKGKPDGHALARIW